MAQSKMRRWEIDAVGRENLQLREVSIPEPRRGEILVKVAAVALNYRDKMVLETGRGLPLDFPFTPGSDLAGEVVALGSDVTRFKHGDRVISTFTPDWIDGPPTAAVEFCNQLRDRLEERRPHKLSNPQRIGLG